MSRSSEPARSWKELGTNTRAAQAGGAGREALGPHGAAPRREDTEGTLALGPARPRFAGRVRVCSPLPPLSAHWPWRLLGREPPSGHPGSPSLGPESPGGAPELG